jgi:hypothetical protein
MIDLSTIDDPQYLDAKGLEWERVFGSVRLLRRIKDGQDYLPDVKFRLFKSPEMQHKAAQIAWELLLERAATYQGAPQLLIAFEIWEPFLDSITKANIYSPPREPIATPEVKVPEPVDLLL